MITIMNTREVNTIIINMADSMQGKLSDLGLGNMVHQVITTKMRPTKTQIIIETRAILPIITIVRMLIGIRIGIHSNGHPVHRDD